MARSSTGGAGGRPPRRPPSFAQTFSAMMRPPLPPRPKAKPKPKKPRVPKVPRPRGPIRPPSRPAASGSSGTAATIPTHATTPARASRSLNDATPAAKARTVVTRTRTPIAAKPPVLTDQQLVQQALAPAYLENDQALAAEQRAEAQRQALIQSLGAGLQNKMGEIAPQVEADYNQAFNATQQMATQGQQALAAANPNQNIDATLAAIGAPPEQRAQIAAQLQQTFQGGGAVLFGREGVVPGTSLASRGAAELAYAKTLPGIAGMQTQQDLTSLLRVAQENQQKIQDQRAQIAAKAPGILQDIQSTRATNAAKQRALDMEAAALGLKAQNQQFTQKVTTQRLGLEKTRVSLQALQADRSWQATLKRLGISQASLKLRAAQLEQKRRTGGFTAAQVSKMKGTAYTIADQAFHGFDETNSQGAVVAHHRPLKYGEALREMLKEGIPLALAQPALNLYYKPNQRTPARPPGLLGPVG